MKDNERTLEISSEVIPTSPSPNFFPPPRFPTWTHVIIGTHRHPPELYKEMREAGAHVMRDMPDSVLSIPQQHQMSTLDLVVTSPEALGLDDMVTMSQLYECAEHHGLAPCPSITYLHLLYSYERDLERAVVQRWLPLHIATPIGEKDRQHSIHRFERASRESRIYACSRTFAYNDDFSPLTRWIFQRLPA